MKFYGISTFGPMPATLPFRWVSTSEMAARKALAVVERARSSRKYAASSIVVAVAPTREAAMAFAKKGEWQAGVEKFGSVGC
jgi:hypothetical protein